MQRFCAASVRGLFSLSLYALNTLLWCPLLLLVALGRALIPMASWQRGCSHLTHAIAQNWISVNGFNQRLTARTRWVVHGSVNLQRRGWYLVLANHQSWVDILVLQRIFNRKIPLLKFFIKKELMWFPLLGQAWWALDFPFVKRYPQKLLARKPHLRGRDRAVTHRACRKFKTMPVAVMNFVEGTRFTPDKHRRQQSPHSHLLRARAGGSAMVLDALGERIHHILDVTIVYPHGPRSFWAFVCGRIREIRVHIRSLPAGPALRGNYAESPAFRNRFQQWLNRLWGDKDRTFNMLLAGASPEAETTDAPSCPARSRITAADRNARPARSYPHPERSNRPDDARVPG